MNEKEEEKDWVVVGECCEKCLNGIMKTFPEEILKDGTVISGKKCNSCGCFYKIHWKPSRSIRKTGVSQCGKCGYEYFYTSIKDYSVKEWLEEIEQFYICPNCGVKYYQYKITESYGPLKHKHGTYGYHPTTRKHGNARGN